MPPRTETPSPVPPLAAPVAGAFPLHGLVLAALALTLGIAYALAS
jgi:hypothetical protein